MPETTCLVNEEEGLRENERGEEAANRSAMPMFQSVITNLHPEIGVLATAEVKIGEICTIRNVKVKENDYGKEVVMPRTKMPYNTGYKDACFFESREMREQFDQSVLEAYELQMNPVYGEESEYGIDSEQQDDMELDDGEGPEMGL